MKHTMLMLMLMLVGLATAANAGTAYVVEVAGDGRVVSRYATEDGAPAIAYTAEGVRYYRMFLTVEEYGADGNGFDVLPDRAARILAAVQAGDGLLDWQEAPRFGSFRGIATTNGDVALVLSEADKTNALMRLSNRRGSLGDTNGVSEADQTVAAFRAVIVELEQIKTTIRTLHGSAAVSNAVPRLTKDQWKNTIRGRLQDADLVLPAPKP